MTKEDKLIIIDIAIDRIDSGRNDFMCNALEAARCIYFKEESYRGGKHTSQIFPELFKIKHSCIELNIDSVWKNAIIHDKLICLIDDNHRIGRIEILEHLKTLI